MALGLPASGIGGGKILRYVIWKKRVNVEASAGDPSLEWIGPLNPTFDPLSMRVNVIPGTVRFGGPIDVTTREVKNGK
ncbi:MAG: hypothetical protein ABI646_08000 [Acidobacteriota bacterium]